jgi:hypothetical protein
MNDGSRGQRPARGWPGSAAGPRRRRARDWTGFAAGRGGRRARGGPDSVAGPRGRSADLRLSEPQRARARMPGARRAAALAAALAGSALLAAACGGGSGAPATAKLTNYQKALAFSQCMRAHGEPGFPDPQPDGSLLINGPKDHLNGALMNKASKACQHLMPLAPPMTAAQQRKVTAEALKFVACMRAHGLPAFPDPKVDSRGIELQVPQGVTPNSAALKNAQQACRNLIPGGSP